MSGLNVMEDVVELGPYIVIGKDKLSKQLLTEVASCIRGS